MTDEPIILGKELAAANNAEAERLATGKLRISPLGVDARYDELRGDYDLVSPVQMPLDQTLISLCRKYAKQDAPSRQEIRQSLNQDDLYVLLHFSSRCAVFALRERDAQWIADGLTALAMIELSRIDWRDAIGPPGLLAAIARLIRVKYQPLIASAVALAEKQLRKYWARTIPVSERSRR